MVTIGTVRGAEITRYRDGEDNVRVLRVELTSPDDLQSVAQITRAGVDSSPHDETRVVVIDIEPSYRVAVSEEDLSTPSVDRGEQELYSYSSAGARLATIKLDSASAVIINGGGDYAIAYSRLKTAFDQLKSDFNNLVTQYNSHTHVAPAGGGATAPPVPLGAPSAADMSSSKVDKIEVP
jgi:hypothetical protein